MAANEVVTPVQLFRPSWADPGFIQSSNDRQFTTVNIPAGTTVKVANNNPKRWGLIILPAVVDVGDVSYGPWNDPATFSLSSAVAGENRTFTLFNHGTIVCGEWYAFSAGGADVRVIELEIG